MAKQLYELSAHELRRMLDQKEVTAVEIAQSVLTRAEQTDKSVQAYLTLRAEAVIQEAEKADEMLRQGEQVGPFTGIPISLKDNISTFGVRTTCASKFLETYVPPYDATVAARLKAMGAPLLGKLNMDEFAMGSGTETSAFFPTKNPWDLSRVPGGSSGGSAAAVAAGSAVISLGTDTGGSIRQPASFCGVVGLMPTYGRVSRFGVVPLASMLDVVGPLAKNVTDAAMMLQAISGADPYDSTSLREDVPDFMAALGRDIQGLVVGLPRQLFGATLSEDVREAVSQAVRLLEKLGAKVQEVDLPHLEYAVSVYRILVAAESSSVLARLDGVRYGYRAADATDVETMFQNSRRDGFGLEVKRRIIRGTYALSPENYQDAFVKAQKVRTLIRQDFEEAFRHCDVLVAPTTPTVAYPLGQQGDDPEVTHAGDMLTVPVNLASLPAISVPCGKGTGGLPIGLQIIAPSRQEERMLQVAYAYEQEAGLLPFTPPLEVDPT